MLLLGLTTFSVRAFSVAVQLHRGLVNGGIRIMSGVLFQSIGKLLGRAIAVVGAIGFDLKVGVLVHRSGLLPGVRVAVVDNLVGALRLFPALRRWFRAFAIRLALAGSLWGGFGYGLGDVGIDFSVINRFRKFGALQAHEHRSGIFRVLIFAVLGDLLEVDLCPDSAYRQRLVQIYWTEMRAPYLIGRVQTRKATEIYMPERVDGKLKTGPSSTRLTTLPMSPVVAFMHAMIIFLSLGVRFTLPESFSLLDDDIVTFSVKVLVGLQEQCVNLYRRSDGVPGWESYGLVPGSDRRGIDN